MSGEANSDLNVEIAKLQTQVAGIATAVNEIRTTMSQVVAMDRQIAELTVHTEQFRKDFDFLFRAHELAKSWQADHEKERDQAKQDIHAAIAQVDTKVEAIVNKGKGALWIGAALFTFTQAVIIGSVAWVFTHVSAADSANAVQEYRLSQIEKSIDHK